MGEILKIREINDLWWSEVTFTDAYSWDSLEINYIGPDTCFVSINGRKMEMNISDYYKIIDNKAFKIKFGLTRHEFKF